MPLNLQGNDRTIIDGDGPAIDWALEMHRLPAGRMLDETIRERRSRERHIVMLADLLVPFYRDAAPAGFSPESYLADLRHGIVTDCGGIARFLPAQQLQLSRIRGSLLDDLESIAPMLAERVRKGRLVEGHGDLRPEHICLEDPPVIFDCLEFNRRFRLIGPVDELSFAGLECEYLDQPGVGRRLLRHYQSATGDEYDRRLVSFHKTAGALMRAGLAVRHLPGTAARGVEAMAAPGVRPCRACRRTRRPSSFRNRPSILNAPGLRHPRDTPAMPCG